MTRLEWKKLFSEDRQRISKGNSITKELSVRNGFDQDYQRIIYSSSLRRLQDKAQVFPLQRNDFTRTRLTHSLEVASIGKSMAWNIAEIMYEKSNGNDKYNISMSGNDMLQFDSLTKMKRLPSMVEVACLVHDLGNPPFGHYGEDVIKNWFSSFFHSENDKGYKFFKYISSGKELTDIEKIDFTSFDGNAQTIHILSKLQFLNDKYGANFTFGSLAALMKYPWNSQENVKGKFGFLQSEQDIFMNIQGKVGIGPHRHPVSYLVEAADDIAYKTADLEDGVKKGLVKWSDIAPTKDEKTYWSENTKQESKTLLSILEDTCAENELMDIYDRMKKNIKEAESNQVPDIDLIRFQNYKIAVQNVYINIAQKTFVENYSLIMEGDFSEKDILSDNSLSNLNENLFLVTNQKCFQSEEVISLELVGDKVITDLLDMFIPAIFLVNDLEDARNKNQKLIKLISDNFLHVHMHFNEASISEISKLPHYQKLQLVIDFISGMTDSYAVNLHKRLMNGMM